MVIPAVVKICNTHLKYSGLICIWITVWHKLPQPVPRLCDSLSIFYQIKQQLTCQYFIIIQTPGSISKKFQITIKVINNSLKVVIKEKNRLILRLHVQSPH